MKWVYFIVSMVLLNACHFLEEEPEVLLSSIDGEEYYALKEGDMNTRKASMLILEGVKDSVGFEVKLDLLDSLETFDSVWRKRYLKAVSLVLKELYSFDNSMFVEDKVFSFFIHRPNELIAHLNNEGFEEIDTWMLILSKGLNKATTPKDITLNSVANAAISNCKECSEKQQKLIVDFVSKLEMYNNLEEK